MKGKNGGRNGTPTSVRLSPELAARIRALKRKGISLPDVVAAGARELERKGT